MAQIKITDYVTEYDDTKLKNIYQDCKSGKLLCGDCKAHLGNKVKIFLKDHQRKLLLSMSYLFLEYHNEHHILIFDQVSYNQLYLVNIFYQTDQLVLVFLMP